MSEKLIVKPANKLVSEEVLEICNLKDQHWSLGIKKQLGIWFMMSNENDKLVFLEKNNKKIGFLRLKLRKIILNQTINNSYIVSEVCVDKEFQKKGFGTMILKKSQEIIKKDRVSGYLLSDDNHKSFYIKHGWNIMRDIYTIEKIN